MAKDRAANAIAELKPSCVCSASKPPGELGLVYAHVQDNTGGYRHCISQDCCPEGFDPTAPEQPERNSQNGDPHNDCRRVHSRRPRISKNGTPEERGAKAGASDWSVEDLARLSVAHLRFTRLRQARQSRADPEARVALVAIERGISTQQLERFYYVKRKGAKKRYFDHRAFAEKYDISIDWIFAGFICEHPRGLDVGPPGMGQS